MAVFSIPSFHIIRWLFRKGVFFALLGLLALDGGLGVTSAFAGVTVTPSTVAFTGTVGPGPLYLPVTFTNSGTSSVSFTWSDSIPWISAGYPGGTLLPGQSVTYTMKAKISGLAAGSYGGTATLSVGGVPQPVQVTLALSSTTTSPAIGLNPSALTFTGIAGGANPAAQSIGISNTDGGTLTWTASDNVSWLTLTPASGTNAGSVSASVNLSGLTTGTYNATVTVAATGATTKTLPVTLTVATATSSGTGFSISPTTLAYTATVGQADKSGSATVTNTGTTAITVTWADSLNFLYGITPGLSQTIPAGLSGTFTLKARNSTFAAGSYNGIAIISGGGITKQVPVTLTISSTTLAPVIGLTTTSLGFAGTVGGTNPSAQNIGISNTGGGTLTWNVGDNAAWLTLSPLSGTNTGTVTASVNLSGLLAGSYTATVTVTATGATAKTIPVTLNVAASTTSGTGFSILPTTLAYTATVGSPNKTASVTVTNTGTTALTVTYSDAVPFLCCSTPGTTLSILPGASGTFTVTARLAGMSAGSYSGTATISGGGLTKPVPVSLTLTSSTAVNQATLSWNANTEPDLAGYKVYQKTSLTGTYTSPITTVPKDTTTYTVTGLTAPTTYYFAIKAYDTAGNESPFSPEASKSVY